MSRVRQDPVHVYRCRSPPSVPGVPTRCLPRVLCSCVPRLRNHADLHTEGRPGGTGRVPPVLVPPATPENPPSRPCNPELLHSFSAQRAETLHLFVALTASLASCHSSPVPATPCPPCLTACPCLPHPVHLSTQPSRVLPRSIVQPGVTRAWDTYHTLALSKRGEEKGGDIWGMGVWCPTTRCPGWDASGASSIKNRGESVTKEPQCSEHPLTADLTAVQQIAPHS